MKFRKKPVVIEAIEVQKIILRRDAILALPQWVQDKVTQRDIEITDTGIRIHTLEGTMWGHHTDWLLKGVNDEVYPCKPDIFAATYEPASEAGP